MTVDGVTAVGFAPKFGSTVTIPVPSVPKLDLRTAVTPAASVTRTARLSTAGVVPMGTTARAGCVAQRANLSELDRRWSECTCGMGTQDDRVRRGQSMALAQWRAEARPIVTALIDAEDMLISRSERPAVVVTALCDQLDAAVRHAQSWLDAHRCPDVKFGTYFDELIAASRGMWAIMQVVAREAPAGEWIGNRDLADKVGTNLMDRIEQARRARVFLLQRTS